MAKNQQQLAKPQQQTNGQVPMVVRIKKMLSTDEVKTRFNDILGKKSPQFMASLVNVVAASSKLSLCNANSIMAAAFVAASYDLPIDSNLGFSAIVPYKQSVFDQQSKRWVKVDVAQFQMMYKGFIQLAIRSGEYERMNCSEVYEDELVSYNPITGECEFASDFSQCTQRMKGEVDKIIGYYAMFRLRCGFIKELYMSRAEIDNHARKYSSAYRYDLNDNKQSSKWSTDFDAMAKKGLALDTLLPTPTGWVTMEEAAVGNYVFDMNGNITKIIAVSEVKNLPCFKVTFSDGETIICDDEHRWVAAIGTNGARDVKLHGWRTYAINELYKAKKSGQRVTVPRIPSLDLPEKELPIDPWLLGYWIGNGSKSHANVTCDLYCLHFYQRITGTSA